MKAISEFFFAIACGAIILLATNSVNAAPQGEWKLQEIFQSNGDSWGFTLFTDTQEGNQVAFRCFEGSLITAFSAEPTNFPAGLSQPGNQKASSVNYSLNGEKPIEAVWLRLPRHKYLIAGKSETSITLFNTFARNEEVKLDSKKYGSLAFDAPTANAELFKEFLTACGYTAK